MPDILDPPQFQHFVPQAAHDYIQQCLEGAGHGEPGLFQAYARHDQVVRLVEEDSGKAANANPKRKRPVPGLQSSADWREILRKRIERVKRLGEDPRMGAAYSKLVGELRTSAQWESFLKAAWTSERDFADIRDNRKAAKLLGEKIANLARELRQALLELQGLDITNKPNELFNVWHLLHLTTEHRLEDGAPLGWHKYREEVLGRAFSIESLSFGNPEERLPSRSFPAGDHIGQVERDLRVITETLGEDERQTYKAWSNAPQLPELLGIISNTARRFEPRADSVSEAAVSSRKSNHKVSYIRAFQANLGQGGSIAMTSALLHAIATTANVMINDPEIDVSYDDVRKASL